MDFPFVLKKILAFFFYPCGVIFLILALACWSSFSRYRRGMTKFFLVLALILFYAFSTPWVPTYFLLPLERRYPEPSREEILKAQAVVLLPAYVGTLPWLKLRERPDPETSKRLLAAVLVAKEYKLPLIVVGSVPPRKKAATYLAQLAQKLGVKKVEAYNQAVDTKSSAEALKERLAGRPFLLVTSACHLPRSVYLFRKVGLKPIPYPAFRTAGVSEDFLRFRPDPRNLVLLRNAIHEYLGLAFYKLEDHISSWKR